MKLLITGARGMMGRDLRNAAEAEGHEVWGTDIAKLEKDPRDRLDITSHKELGKALDRFRPDWVLHLAALTDVDHCEREPEDAWRVNALGTESLAVLCREQNCGLLYVSTGSVFPGDKRGPYHEFDSPGPVSVYARSKYFGEEAVRRLVARHYVVRAGWMFGGGPEDKKFVAKMIERARTSELLLAVDDKIGSPTYTLDIARRCLELLSTESFGTYHAANEGECTRFEMAKAILQAAGIENCEVQPCSSAQFPLAAFRPASEAIEGLRAKLIGLTPMRDWRIALSEYVQTTFR
jgi:dTDP-4-dehydrorhamnose reductase